MKRTAKLAFAAVAAIGFAAVALPVTAHQAHQGDNANMMGAMGDGMGMMGQGMMGNN